MFAGYPILFEWLGRGRTLGKLWLGLRVVRDDGGPISFRQAFTRGLTGLVLEKPGLLGPITTALGLIVMASSESSKRIGDHLAGTFVVNERVGTQARALVAPPLFVPWELQGWAMSLDLTRLDDQLALSVRQFVTRANDLTPAARASLESDLANRVAALVAPPPPMPIPASALLITVLAERRRRAELASMPPPSYPPGAYQPGAYQPADPHAAYPPASSPTAPPTPNGPAPTRETGPFTPPS